MRCEARVGVLLFRSQRTDKIVIMIHYETRLQRHFLFQKINKIQGLG